MSEDKKTQKVVTRYAPSPTGFQHVGNIRTALYAWLVARKYGGEFIWRLEDTDQKREVEGAVDHIRKCLTWLSLDWDQGLDVGGPHAPYIQSERLSIYLEWAHKLIEKGLAYPDPYSEEELETFRKQADAEKRAFLFRDHRPKTFEVWDSTKPLRFKVPELKRYTWTDLVWGELSAGPEALDDFILIKSDGFPTYNFAHIVDDITMEVTHVMRGQEFIASTPKYLSVYDALGVTPPHFATTPPVMADGGKKKLGKRDGAKDILEYQKEGYLPEAMINFLALLGWHPEGDREVFTRAELISAFEIHRIQRSGAQFGDDKLDWLNKEHMKLMSEETRIAEIFSQLKKNQTLENNEKLSDTVFLSKLYPIIFERISKWGDIHTLIEEGELTYFFKDPLYEASTLSWKGESPATETTTHLTYVIEVLNNASDTMYSSPESIKTLLFDYATEHGRGNVLWPIRVALSGRDKSPDPFTLIYILGKNETIIRLKHAIEKLNS